MSLRTPDGGVAERIRLRWATRPPAAVVLDALARHALAARRRGLTLRVERPSGQLAMLVQVAGLAAPAGPIEAATSLDDGGGQPEAGEQ